MGKISPVAAKYIVRAKFTAEGIVEKPDVIGAIFGQSEGLLGPGLELRELQKNGRVGRIEITVESKGGKSEGIIEIPSSLDKTETAMIGAAVETIDRIGPCNASIRVEKIEDVRVGKRDYILQRARDLVKDMMSAVPDSGEMAEDVQTSMRTAELVELGPDKLAAGPGAETSDEVILLEGRADVINLLKQGFTNVIAIGGTKIPESLPDVLKGKKVTVFLDGDRGGDLILKELRQVSPPDFIARAPGGEEVEELTSKEIHQCLRNKISAEQKPEPTRMPQTVTPEREVHRTGGRRMTSERGPMRPSTLRRVRVDDKHRNAFKSLLDDVSGSKGAILLDKNLDILGKVPLNELTNTLQEMEGTEFVVMDGDIDREIAYAAQSSRVKYVIGTSRSGMARGTKLLTPEDLQ